MGHTSPEERTAGRTELESRTQQRTHGTPGVYPSVHQSIKTHLTSSEEQTNKRTGHERRATPRSRSRKTSTKAHYFAINRHGHHVSLCFPAVPSSGGLQFSIPVWGGSIILRKSECFIRLPGDGPWGLISTNATNPKTQTNPPGVDITAGLQAWGDVSAEQVSTPGDGARSRSGDQCGGGCSCTGRRGCLWCCLPRQFLLMARKH